MGRDEKGKEMNNTKGKKDKEKDIHVTKKRYT